MLIASRQRDNVIELEGQENIMSYGAAATNLVMMQKQTTLLPKKHGDIVVALFSCAQLCSATGKDGWGTL